MALLRRTDCLYESCLQLHPTLKVVFTGPGLERFQTARLKSPEFLGTDWARDGHGARLCDPQSQPQDTKNPAESRG